MRMKLVVLFAAAICLLGSVAASAQSYAITNARIVTVSGATIDKGTIVIRGGLIDSVGATVTPPADATVIDVGGATVYPGFIDTLTSLGMPAARPVTGGPGGGQAAAAASPTPVSNSNYPAGLRPEDMAESEIRAGDSQFEASRNVGFTTALTTGRSGIFTGQSAVINLSGDSVSTLVVKSPFAQHVSFVTLGGGYPGSLLGTFSALRQIFNDAKRLQENQKAYAADPRGMKRPEGDRSLEALFPAINRQMPVVFSANREIEIVRALDFIRDYNLVGIIAGGQEAGNVASRLKAQNVTVLLSLNFPKRTASASPDADPESMDTLRFRAEVPKTAGRLAAAGVKFAFQSGGATAADYFSNAGKSVENGLSRDAAIRAMTLGAAEMLGVDNRLGSVEAGKIANLVVMKGDIFGRDRFASHVFVDGKLFEQKETSRPQGGPRSSAGGPPPAESLSGAYKVTIDIPGAPSAATFNFTQSGTGLAGTMVSDAGTAVIRDGKATGNAFSFATTVTYGGTNIDVTVQGTVRGNQISGTVGSPIGEVPFAGTKTP